MSSFQGVGIEEFHYIQRCPHFMRLDRENQFLFLFFLQNFRKLLLHKCQEEFENRRRATAAFDSCNDGLSPEEEEQMGVAKRKMLGNVKFVGES